MRILRGNIVLILFSCLSMVVYAQQREPMDKFGGGNQDLSMKSQDFFDPNQKKKEKELPYQFGVEWRLEAGYVQPNQRSKNNTYPNMYLHGARIGATADFMLPKHFSIQAGLLYTIAYGEQTQSWGPMSYDDQYAQSMQIKHRILSHQLTIPVRAHYNIHLVKKFNMFFYTGPQLHIGLAQMDYLESGVTQQTQQWMQANAIPYEPYDKYQVGELNRANIQWGVGGGFEWDKYRIQAGYDFGLNNLVKHKAISNQHMWEWSWFVSFAYRL